MILAYTGLEGAHTYCNKVHVLGWSHVFISHSIVVVVLCIVCVIPSCPHPGNLGMG